MIPTPAPHKMKPYDHMFVLEGLLNTVNRTEIVLIRNSSAINFIINKA